MRAEQLLKQMGELKRKFQNAQLFIVEDWLLEHGEAFGPAVSVEGVEMKPIKQCFQNSFQALFYGEVDDDEWFYTEGVVVFDDLPIDIAHAWLSNRKGEVLDLTLRGQDRPRSYFGVPFRFEAVEKLVFEQDHYGLFSDGVRYQPVVQKPLGDERAWKKGER